jgi:uncharacterized repeat protein (TIGR01451 family)
MLLALAALTLPATSAKALNANPRLGVTVRGSLDPTCGNADDMQTLVVAPGQQFYMCYGILNPFPYGSPDATQVTGIKVVDSFPVAGTQIPWTLPLGPAQKAWVATGPHTAVGDEYHEVTAIGDDAYYHRTFLGGPDRGWVVVLQPSLSIQKTVSTDGTCPGTELVTVAPGTPVTYCYSVTNTGNVAVDGITITDDGSSIPVGNLASGQTASASSSYAPTSDTNTPAVAAGTVASSGTPVTSPPDGAEVKVASPTLSIATTVSLDGTCPGSEIVNVLSGTAVTWCYVVTNTGSIAVDDVQVIDDVYGALGAPAVSLDVGESVTLSRAVASVDADTMVAAVASGVAPITNQPVQSNEDPAAVNVVGPQVDIDVTVSTNGSCPGVDTATVPAGTTVTYCYDVKNIGDDELIDVDVVNQDNDLVGTVLTLQPGQSEMIVGTSFVVTSDDQEQATATGTDIYGFGVTASDLAKVHPLFAKIAIQKTVSTDGTCPGAEHATVLAGTSVTYCYEVTNTGDTALNAITVVDDNGAVVNVPDLAPGASATVSAPYVASADADTMATAHATNTPVGGAVVSTPDDASVSVVAPVLWVEKTVSTDGLCPGVENVTVLEGAAVTYCYKVTNAGNAPVAGILVSDAGDVIGAGALAPGESTTVSSTFAATVDVSTAATASGTETILGTPVSAPPDGAAVDVVHPALSIQKTVSLDGQCPGVELVTVLSGTSVTTCYEVTNTGDTTVNGVVITDAGVSISIGDLPAGATAEGTATIIATVDSNTSATANGTDEATGTPVASGPDGAAIDVVSPSLEIAKTASADGTCPGSELVTVIAGSSVAWCYAVTNTGDTMVTGVTVSDADGSLVTIGDLAPGATGNGSAAFSATVDVNTFAGASGDVPALSATVTSPLDNASVDVVSPSLAIEKTVSTDGLCPGSELVTVLANTDVTYCYAVTNTGDTPVTGVVVSDNGNTVVVGDLGPGQSGSGSTTIPALGDNNTPAVASGSVPATGTPIASPPDAAAVDVVTPVLSIATTVSTDGNCPGAEVVNVLAGTAVTWCYAVTNTGDTPVAGITVTDSAYGLVPGAAFDLAPGASQTLSLGAAANVDVTLTASASGTAPATGTPVVSPQDPAVVNVVSPNVDIDVTVSTDGSCPGADNVEVPAGTSVVYCYSVTNNGDEVLSNVVVTDGANNEIGTLSDLGPGETTLLASDPVIVSGDTTVPATAEGTDVYGFPVSDSDTALVKALFAKLQIQKTASLDGQCPGVELVTVLPGTQVTYCYVVTNTGDTAVTSVHVDDVGTIIPVGNLTPGQSQIVASSVFATVDEDTFAVAVGTNPANNQPVTSAEDDAAIVVVHPMINVTKTVSLDGNCPGLPLVTVLAGTTVTYCYEVANGGDTTIGDIIVTDAGNDISIDTLAAGESTIVSSTIEVASDDLSSAATAQGTDNATWTKVVSLPSTAVVDVIHPALSVATTVSTDGTCPGAEIVNVLAGTSVTWCYAVSNTGDVPVNGVLTSDDVFGVVDSSPVTLGVGESVTLSRAAAASIDQTITATASGTDALLGTPVQSAPDSAAVNVVSPSIDIDVTVSTNGTCPGIDSVTVSAGASVVYCYDVANVGDEVLSGVVIKDAGGNTVATIGTLDAGASSSFASAPSSPTGVVTVTGVASGTDEYGYPVSDSDSAIVHVVSANLHIVKTAPAEIDLHPSSGGSSGGSGSGSCGDDDDDDHHGYHWGSCNGGHSGPCNGKKHNSNQGSGSCGGSSSGSSGSSNNNYQHWGSCHGGHTGPCNGQPNGSHWGSCHGGHNGSCDGHNHDDDHWGSCSGHHSGPCSGHDDDDHHGYGSHHGDDDDDDGSCGGGSGGSGGGTTASNALTYKIVVTNIGSGTAATPVVTDALPSGTSFVSATTTLGTCSYANGTVTCALPNLAAGAKATIKVNVSVTALTGTLSNTAVVSTSTPETDLSDNTSTATTKIIGGGCTRTQGFYANHPSFTEACLASLGGTMDLGWYKLKNETCDDEIDDDKDKRKESGIAMVMGILNANVSKYTNNASRSSLQKSKIKAARQLAAAICNWKYLGTPPPFDINAMIQAMKGSNAQLIDSYAAKCDTYNNSGDSVPLPVNAGPANSKYPWDDPSDPND